MKNRDVMMADLPSSDEESLQSNFSDEEDFDVYSKSKKSKSKKQSKQKPAVEIRTRNAGRKTRVRYEGLDESYGEEEEEPEEE